MESENPVILESCGEDSILIQTVENIVSENTCPPSENEEGFFVVADAQSEQQNVTDTSNEELMETQSDEFSWSTLCRVCAHSSDHVIPIFEGEGLEHDLYNKLHKHLPIRVSESDTLPLQLCFHCAATLLAWHELAVGCLDAEKKLLEIQNIIQERKVSEIPSQETPTQDITVSNVAECLQLQENTKNEPPEDSDINNLDRWKSENINNEEAEYFQCVQCDIFVDLKHFVNHMNDIHEGQVHYCQYCKLVYECTEKKFEEHMLVHDNYCNDLKDITKEDTAKEDKKENKERECTVDIKKPLTYECNKCKRSFKKKALLIKHITGHSNSNNIETPDETELLSEAKQMINDRLSYKCGTCKKIIFTKRGFLRHIRVHFNKRPCVCNLCGNSYRIEQDLARHIRDVHEGLKKYVCDICGRAFANKGAKEDHRRIHTGERPYPCEHCPKMFRTLNSVYIHNRVHTDYKPHKCSYCGKHFRSRQRLTHHETTHTGIKAFSCDICGKTFSVKGEVMRHRTIHSSEKPFVCKCGMKFGQKRYLRNHIKQHHKEASSWMLADLLKQGS